MRMEDEEGKMSRGEGVIYGGWLQREDGICNGLSCASLISSRATDAPPQYGVRTDVQA